MSDPEKCLLQQASHEGDTSQLFPRLGPLQTLQDLIISGTGTLGDAFLRNFYRSGVLKFQDKLQEKLTERKSL